MIFVIKFHFARFEVLITELMNNQLYWDIIYIYIYLFIYYIGNLPTCWRCFL